MTFLKLLKYLPNFFKKLYNLIMIKIRRLTYFDCPKLKKLVSYLSDDDNIQENMSFSIINSILPLPLKFKSESFILIKDKEICGLITVAVTAGNHYKINITRLIFKENDYETAKTLVNFVVQKFGAKGAHTFTVTVDECHEELFELFINGCGFRQCGCETLWKQDKPTPQKTNLKFRIAQNSDAKAIAELFNSEIDPIFKPSLIKTPQEFKDKIFTGFDNYYRNCYLLETEQSLIGYFSITTSDNQNYIIDITTNSGYEIDYNEILNTLLCKIAEKKHAFYPFIKQKKYIKETDKLNEFLTNTNFYPVQTNHILVKDFYKQETAPANNWKIFLLGENKISGEII